VEFRVTRAEYCGCRLVEHNGVGVAAHGPADRDALTLAPRQIGDRPIHNDADASEADHVNENPLQDLLLALDVGEGQVVLGRFAFGRNRFGSVSAAGRDIGPVDAWVFLAPGRFAAKTPVHEPWIVLDFLGFFRPNPDFSMGYAA
jgi:hypothetical protein